MGTYLNKSGQPIRLDPRSTGALAAAQAAPARSIGLALFAHVLPVEDDEAKQRLQEVRMRSGDWIQDHPAVHLLKQAGYRPIRPGGLDVFADDGRTDWDGSFSWDPDVPLAKVDDQDNVPARRFAGEVALAAALRSEMNSRGLSWELVRRVPAGQTRGADFKHSFAKYIANQLPDEWEIRSELPLNER